MAKNKDRAAVKRGHVKDRVERIENNYQSFKGKGQARRNEQLTQQRLAPQSMESENPDQQNDSEILKTPQRNSKSPQSSYSEQISSS